MMEVDCFSTLEQIHQSQLPSPTNKQIQGRVQMPFNMDLRITLTISHAPRTNHQHKWQDCLRDIHPAKPRNGLKNSETFLSTEFLTIQTVLNKFVRQSSLAPAPATAYRLGPSIRLLETNNSRKRLQGGGSSAKRRANVHKREIPIAMQNTLISSHH
jgi:hypothetical protein